MASADALPVPRKNVAFRVYFEIRKNDGTVITAAASISATISLDGATFAALTGTPTVTEIATSSGVYYVDIAQADMNADAVVLKVTSTTTGAVPVVIALYPALSTEIPVDVQAIGGNTTAPGYQANLLAMGVASAAVDTATFTATSTVFECTTPNTPANTAADYYKGRVCIFTGSGASNLQGQVARVTASTYSANSKLKLTVTALTAAPANSAPFYLV